MGKAPRPTIKASDLESGQRVIDPEGNVATVRRYQWIDHQRGRLSTDLGVRVMNHDDRLHLAE